MLILEQRPPDGALATACVEIKFGAFVLNAVAVLNALRFLTFAGRRGFI